MNQDTRKSSIPSPILDELEHLLPLVLDESERESILTLVTECKSPKQEILNMLLTVQFHLLARLRDVLSVEKICASKLSARARSNPGKGMLYEAFVVEVAVYNLQQNLLMSSQGLLLLVNIRLGKRIGNALGENENADTQLSLKSGESLSIHGVVLMVQCPSLLQTVELPLDKGSSEGFPVRQYTELTKKFKKEVHLSSHVHHLPLVKLLEFVYLGYLQAGEDLLKSLKSFAKHCKLQPLLQMLHRNRPKWGMAFPGLDLALALNSDGHTFSDVALEAEATEVMQWTCKFCPVLVPHMHVHKVILWSSCDYFRAMFRSGMQESRSPFIKVPVSWEALVKLVDWLYSDKLPTLVTGCLWDNMDERKKLKELQPYLELCWLADYWLLDDIQEHCSRVINSCLDSSGNLSLEVLQIAARLSLWKLAETAVNHLGPSYSRLRLTGEIEKLDKDLADMVRVASVRHSQDSTKCKLEE